MNSHAIETDIRHMTPVSAPPEQKADVVALSDALDHLADRRCELVGPHGEAVVVPEAVFFVLARVAEVLARGDSITVVPVGKELTTQQAANLLNVSRQYLVRMLDEGRLPFTRTGKHRRLRIDDVLAFKVRRDRDRGEALDALAAMSEDAGGYDELSTDVKKP